MQLSGFAEYIEDLLSEFGIIKLRRMFGGYGVYKNDLIIAIIADDELYFKANKEDSHYYEQFNTQPYKPTVMSYWKAPLEVLEDDELLGQWVDKAYQASIVQHSQKS